MKPDSYNFGAIQFKEYMRGILILLLGLLCQAVQAQHLDIVELGNLVGEMERFESRVSWTNNTNDTVRVKPWTDRKELDFDEALFSVAPGAKVDFAYGLDLTSTLGKQQFEARLVTADEVVIHGWLLRTRIFEAEEDVFKEYRHDYFPFRSKSEILNMKSAFKGQSIKSSFSLYNFGGKEEELTGAYTDEPGVKVSFGPEKVSHHAFTRITVALETRDKALGFTRENFSVFRADSSLLFSIPLQYTLEQMPSDDITEAVPHLTVSKLTHDFKVMEVGEVEQIDIRLTNTGHAPLYIEKLESNCDCLAFEMDSKELSSGQSTSLRVTFNATGRMGYERKTLALFTNDPDQPTRVLTFKAHVK